MKRLFISHASEDKASFVRPLVDHLLGRGIDLWYDNFELFPGDSIREGIDRGLVECDVGLCIFSRSFFQKKWTSDELGGIFAKETLNRRLIIPVWLQIDKSYLVGIAPMLADRLGIDGSQPIDQVAAQVICTLRHRFLSEANAHTDDAHRYFNPPTDLPQLGYRFESSQGFNRITEQLRPREILFAFWRHNNGHYCACHIGSEARFLQIAEDASVQFFAVDRNKVELGLDPPLGDA